MSQTIPYFFVWTPKYEIFATILKKCIDTYDSLFEEMSIFITQEEWDIQTNKVDGHIMNGCAIKLQTVFRLLNELPENSYFIFSDADILLNKDKPLRELLEFYIKVDADIVFMRESLNMNISNIGFSLIKVNDINRKLFKNVIDMYNFDKYGLDQSFVNESLKTYDGTQYWFPPELVVTTCTDIDLEKKSQSIQKMRNNYIVYQALSDAHMPFEFQKKQKILNYKSVGYLI